MIRPKRCLLDANAHRAKLNMLCLTKFEPYRNYLRSLTSIGQGALSVQPASCVARTFWGRDVRWRHSLYRPIG